MIIVQASGWEVRADEGSEVRVRSPSGLSAVIANTWDFNSELARMSTVVDCGEPGVMRAVVKGSPESIADLCQLSTCALPPSAALGQTHARTRDGAREMSDEGR